MRVRLEGCGQSRYESEAGVEVVRDDPREAGNTSFSHHLNPHLGV